jgi:hypothetical protein
VDAKLFKFGVAVPQYLFRTFQSNDSVIASIASTTKSALARINLLRLEKRAATQILHGHLVKSLWGGHEQDNLMSWTSSFLFAIQYAIYRLQYNNSPSDIKMCVVATSKFPEGQFMRDLALIKTYYSTAEELEDERARKFFDLRLRDERYYNGEYLSQGAVSIAGRSTVVSLQDLIQAGLFESYPEFEDPSGRDKWAKQVRDLRQDWALERRTTDREIDLALQIERLCFPQFHALSIAAALLMFKNRKLSSKCASLSYQLFSSRPNCTSGKHAPRDAEQPLWADKPDEVRHGWRATQAMQAFNLCSAPSMPRFIHYIQGRDTLRQLFV